MKRITFFLARLPLLVLISMIGMGVARGGASEIVGWRLSKRIVIQGPVVGAEKLQDEEAAHGLDIDIRDASETDSEGADPSPLVRALVGVLSEMDVGRFELSGGRLVLEGIADAQKVDSLSKRIETATPPETRIKTLRIDPSDRAPFHWSAELGGGDAFGGAITLRGDVADESSRAKLVGLARSISNDDYPVLDMMLTRSKLPRDASAVSEVLLAQLSVLKQGFAWIYGNRVDLIGVSSTVAATGSRTGCRALAKSLPKGIECGVVDIRREVRRTSRRHHHYHHRNGYGRVSPWANDSGRPPSRATSYAAVKPGPLTSTKLVDKSSDPRVVDIPFATVRQRSSDDAESEAGAASYSGERSSSLEFGRARVRVPEDHKIGRIELPGGLSIFGIQITTEETDPERHFLLRSVQSLSQAQWDTLIDAIGPHEALIFVHGFNNSFEDAVFRFAQIVWDLQYRDRGLPVLFSWASRGSVVDYEYDRNSALIAREAFMRLLDNLSKEHKISTVHIIAHSMGNFLVLDALANRAELSGMGHFIMAAPDVDRNQFEQEVPKISRLFKGLTLYASSTDRALALSMKVAGGVPRAGYVPPEGPIVLPSLETLDVSALGQEMFGLNHGTFAEARPLIDDIGLILAKGTRPPRLSQQRPVPEHVNDPKYWRFAP